MQCSHHIQDSPKQVTVPMASHGPVDIVQRAKRERSLKTVRDLCPKPEAEIPEIPNVSLSTQTSRRNQKKYSTGETNIRQMSGWEMRWESANMYRGKRRA